MRRRAAPRRSAWARVAVLRVVATSLATALLTALSITSSVAARPTASDAPGAAASGVPAALTATADSLPSAGAGAHLRSSPPGGGALAAEQDDTDVHGLSPPSADVSHRVRPVGPTVSGARTAAGAAPRPPAGATSTVRGRAPPA